MLVSVCSPGSLLTVVLWLLRSSVIGCCRDQRRFRSPVTFREESFSRLDPSGVFHGSAGGTAGGDAMAGGHESSPLQSQGSSHSLLGQKLMLEQQLTKECSLIRPPLPPQGATLAPANSQAPTSHPLGTYSIQQFLVRFPGDCSIFPSSSSVTCCIHTHFKVWFDVTHGHSLAIPWCTKARERSGPLCPTFTTVTSHPCSKQSTIPARFRAS